MPGTTPTTTPRLRMPAEWAPHAATWTSWPFDDDLWVGHLDGVRSEFADMVATIARFEPVNLNVRDEEAETDARRRIARSEEHTSALQSRENIVCRLLLD